MDNISGVSFNGNSLSSEKSYYLVNLEKTKDDFLASKTYKNFIKAVEKIVRESDEYAYVKNCLMNILQMKNCAVLSNITDMDDELEMHHGPILTLYDIVSIILNYHIKNNIPITTHKLAKIVLQEHMDGNVQLVMLSETIHQLVHAGQIFLHPKQAYGDVYTFLKKYKDGLSDIQIDTISSYIQLFEEDKLEVIHSDGLLESDKVVDWKDKFDRIKKDIVLQEIKGDDFNNDL